MMAGVSCCLRGSSGDQMMATGLSDMRQASEADEFNEECSGKKKSKFKTFKNFFAKKKRTDSAAPRGENVLKQCQSISNVSIPEPSAATPDSETGSQSSIGNRAVSHDSIFIPELSISDTAPVRVTSQENVPGRVKALQLQLQQNIRLASPGVLISTKKTDDAGTLSEDDGLPRSPPEISSLHAILRCSTPKPAALVERHSSLSLGGTESEDEEQISSKPSSRPLSPLSPLVIMTTSSDSLPVDFSSPATPFACLDNSAARHKIAVNPRRHKLLAKQMKPTIREYSGSPKIPKLILLESKDEKDRITTCTGDLQGENGAEIDLLAQGGDSKPATNGEEFAENLSQSSKMLEVSYSHSPELEGTCDGKSKGQNGDVLPNLPMQVTFDSEKVTTSENAHDSEKFPNIQGLSRGTLPMHEKDFNSTSVKSCMEDKEDTEYSSPMPPMAISESMECSEKNYQDKDGENATFENTGDLLPPSADKPPTEEGISVAMHTEGNAKGNSPNTMQHSPTSERMKGESSVAPSGVTSFKEKEGQEENISTDGSITGGAGVKSLLNHRAEYEQTSSDELIDNIGFTSDIPYEDLIIHYDPSTPQLLCSQGQAELSTPGEPLQKDNRLVNQGSIKFSIASAWQRSLLEANRKNECLDTDSSPLTAQQSENYETIAEENGNEVLSSQNLESSSKYQRFLNQPLKMKSNSTESTSADNSCLQNVVNQETKTGLNTKENPFGVKLRRISPLHKFSSEGNVEQKVADGQQSMGIIPCTGTQTPVPEVSDAGARGQAEAASMSRMEKDFGKRATKLSPESHKLRYRPAGKADSVDASTEFATQEKYSTARGKSERKESQTQLDFGPASDNASTGIGTSEPVWVSMARQKQKGFHGQYPDTQNGTQPLENKFVAQMDVKKETTNPLREKAGNKNPVPNFQNKEMNISVKQEDQSKTKTPPGPGSHLQPKQQACGMGMREKRPMPNVKIAPLATGEPPWLAIAKKKAKAWSDMPQTVQ
ncbi:capping protein inhibiting regulator of actin dynamics isoform X1 [Scyliorhinus canicula]|uniref:capping protein inhibiting regulator of actin dynamics isoform X1 n=2 Tax=Scyliorhinus canicula TaxID=7830 RepID=UPI0018F78308|nr:capping protein inhibiting regulator of actin dynamics isoform X1 [Scyliorhinus canicula]